MLDDREEVRAARGNRWLLVNERQLYHPMSSWVWLDLGKVEPSLLPYRWIMPFENTPLPSAVPPAPKMLNHASRRIQVAAEAAARRAAEVTTSP